MKNEMNLTKLVEKFGSEEKCHAYLEHLRWPDGVRCPRCQSDKISRIRKRYQYDCDGCRYQFSVRVGTIFHDSKLPLWKWFLAIYMTVESKKGISANQLKRMLNVSYKTAWYLAHRIRAAMKDGNPELLRGIVEVDETFVGGRNRYMGLPHFGNKAIVVGAIQRGGEVRLDIVQKRDRKSLHGFINRVTHDDTKEIHTDEWPPYVGIGDENTQHKRVHHESKQWVHANVHTNTIEGVWSLFKRSIVGSYHKLSVKHMPAYLDEMEYRYNNRKNEYLFRDTLSRLLESSTISYSSLVK
jgi:transposase-like protein